MVRVAHDYWQSECHRVRPIPQEKTKSLVLFWPRTQELLGPKGELIIIITLTNKNSTKLPSNTSPPLIVVQFSDHIRKVSLADNTKSHNRTK